MVYFWNGTFIDGGIDLVDDGTNGFDESIPNLLPSDRSRICIFSDVTRSVVEVSSLGHGYALWIRGWSVLLY